jgi:opacity protein-like surface antigen
MRGFFSLGVLFIGVLALAIPRCMSEENRRSVTFSASGGIGVVSSVASFQGVRDVRVSAPRAFGLGVGYGPFRFVYDTRFFLSVEGQSFAVGTSEAELRRYPYGTARLRIESAAGLVYASLSAPSRLSPFVRLGLGAARVEFEETYSSTELRDILIDYWALAYGLGAGSITSSPAGLGSQRSTRGSTSLVRNAVAGAMAL